MSETSSPEFREHKIEWTREKAGRFWRSFVPNAKAEEYFSNTAGESIVVEARKRGAQLGGRVLDYGCGPGHLLAHLVKQGVQCEGADFDQTAVDATNTRLRGKGKFQGAKLISALPSSLPAGGYDTVFLVETIEHLIGSDLPDTIVELHRLLRPGGTVVVTTPHNERLAAAERCCPECGCVFHHMQHVSSFTRESLATRLAQHGFATVVCDPISFRRSPELTTVLAIADRIRGKTPKTLLYIGKKPA